MKTNHFEFPSFGTLQPSSTGQSKVCSGTGIMILAQDSWLVFRSTGLVISVPQITLTDFAESYIRKKYYKKRSLYFPQCIAGVLKSPRSQIGAKSRARSYYGHRPLIETWKDRSITCIKIWEKERWGLYPLYHLIRRC